MPTVCRIARIQNYFQYLAHLECYFFSNKLSFDGVVRTDYNFFSAEKKRKGLPVGGNVVGRLFTKRL